MRAASQTICELFTRQVAANGRRRPALHVPVEGGYVTRTWLDIEERVQHTSGALIAMGVEQQDRVLHVSENSEQWIYTDLALQAIGAVHVPAHANSSGQQLAWLIRHSGACLVLLSTPEQVAKLVQSQPNLPDGVRYLCYQPCSLKIQGHTVANLSEFSPGATLQRRYAPEAQRNLVTILYTSGTMGEPKGVMLSHQNLLSNTLGVLEAFEQQASDVRLNFLPLSHVYARTCDLYTWIACGCELALAHSRDSVWSDCARIRPTLLNGVPYFFQKTMRTLHDTADAQALRQLLGGRIRYCNSGGAPLPDGVFDYFEQRGVPLIQGYGLTETSPVITSSTPARYRRGTVGFPIAGVEVRLAEDDEILTRGPHVMQGYWNDQAATAAVICEGWLATGDLGQWDDEGFLRITGRKKEILLMATGKSVAPAQLESLLTEDPLVQQAMIVGEGRGYLAALLVPDRDGLAAHLKSLDPPLSEEALRHPRIVALYEQVVAARLAGLATHQQVRRICLLPRSFTIEQGELTLKSSLRRPVIERHFAEQIKTLYGRRD